MASLHEIVIDCEHAPSLARFWAAALDGYEIRPYDDAEIAELAAKGLTPETDPVVMLDGPGPVVCCQQVPEPKVAKNRVHVDVMSADRRAEVDGLVGLGASVAHEFDGWTLMQDPEGNEFCVTDSR
ncbi:MAG TPA: VOC family protein [Nocardioidaceae bacterium]|nr:VOC family protein [Nocardioidaceae bacterium]